MNLDQLNNVSLYVGKVTELDKETWVVKFICESLNKDAEFKAAPLFNHTYEITNGDQVLIIKPNGTFSDNLFYLPITLRKYIGLKNGQSFIDMTDPNRIYITSPVQLVLKSESGIITLTNNSVMIQGNVDILGNVSVKSGYNGAILDAFGIKRIVKNGIIYE